MAASRASTARLSRRSTFFEFIDERPPGRRFRLRTGALDTDFSNDKEAEMAVCEVCGNDYDKSFEVRDFEGTTHVFDSFECAIHALAPTCAHCRCRVIGHGVEAGGRVFCCAHCAQEEGVSEMRDRV
jgi:hypothetical protein